MPCQGRCVRCGDTSTHSPVSALRLRCGWWTKVIGAFYSRAVCSVSQGCVSGVNVGEASLDRSTHLRSVRSLRVASPVWTLDMRHWSVLLTCGSFGLSGLRLRCGLWRSAIKTIYPLEVRPVSRMGVCTTRWRRPTLPSGAARIWRGCGTIIMVHRASQRSQEPRGMLALT